MTALIYKNLSFLDQKNRVKVVFLSIYYFFLSKNDLENIGKFTINHNSIMFDQKKKEQNVRKKFEYLLTNGFKKLKSSVNAKPALYVHQHSGIPLIGSIEFGIIDRGTNTIEIKPLTTCNIDCIFCSVDHTKRNSDVIVEADYLIKELNKVIQIKQNRVNIHIGSQGDSSLYSDLEYLVKKIRENKKVNAISIVTNGILITKKKADKLINAGITHFHFSVHSLDQERANKLANGTYPIKKVMEVCKYIASRNDAHLLLVPVWMAGINEKDVEDVILFGKKIGCSLGVQNFLEYKLGKKPVSPIPMKLFIKKLHDLENKFNVNLTSLQSDLEFKKDNSLEKPFKKNAIIEVELKARNRLKNSVIGVAENRVVTVFNCEKTRGSMKVKIIRDKDNIFNAISV